MRYKILLAGKNKNVIDDFFNVMSDDFDCMTTSSRGGDIVNHVKFFQPDAFVYCFGTETKDEILKLAAAIKAVDIKYRELILIGNQEPCNEFMRLNPDIVKLMLYRPIVAGRIKKELVEYCEKNAPKKHEPEQPVVRELKKEEYEDNEVMPVPVSEVKTEIKPKVELEVKQEVVEKTKPETVIEAENNQKHILVIDDDPIMLRLIKNELKEQYNIATAVSGKIGLKFLGRKKTDLILLDYEMPEENGVVILEKLRANSETKDIPVVFLTGINDGEKIRKVISMKPQGYLLKPIQHEQLMDTIKKLIG